MLHFLFHSKLIRFALLLALLAWLVQAAAAPVQSSAPRITALGLGSAAHLRVGIDALPAKLDEQQALGMNWTREVLPWYEVEPTAGALQTAYSLETRYIDFERMLDEAHQRGLRVVLALEGGPAYLTHRWPGQPVDSQALLEHWRAYVAAVAQRFGSRVDAWEIGGEPNSPTGWGRWLYPTAPDATAPPDPALYARLLQSAYAILKDADPGAPVLLGGLSLPHPGECVTNPLEFLQAVAAAGAWNALDGVALHLYGSTAPPEQTPVSWQDPLGEFCASAETLLSPLDGVQAVQQVIHLAGDKPLWITSLSWDITLLQPVVSERGGLPDALQSDYLVRTLVPLLSRPHVALILIGDQTADAQHPGRALTPTTRQTLANLSGLLMDSLPLGRQGGEAAGSLHEYRFIQNSRLVVIAWRSEDGDTLRPVALSALGGRQVFAYPSDAANLSLSEDALTPLNANGSLTIALNERPLLLITRPRSLPERIRLTVQDRAAALVETAETQTQAGLSRIKSAALARLNLWLDGLKAKIMQSVALRLER